MSIWTHVHGIIRYDRIQSMDFGIKMGNLSKPYPEYLLDYQIKEVPRPTGSEGPLHLELWVNPDPGSLASMNIFIWGDLRSFEPVDCIEIDRYFERLTINQSTRDAVLSYYTEGDDTFKVLIWDLGKWDKKNKRFKQRILKTEIAKYK